MLVLQSLPEKYRIGETHAFVTLTSVTVTSCISALCSGVCHSYFDSSVEYPACCSIWLELPGVQHMVGPFLIKQQEPMFVFCFVPRMTVSPRAALTLALAVTMKVIH